MAYCVWCEWCEYTLGKWSWHFLKNSSTVQEFLGQNLKEVQKPFISSKRGLAYQQTIQRKFPQTFYFDVLHWNELSSAWLSLVSTSLEETVFGAELYVSFGCYFPSVLLSAPLFMPQSWRMDMNISFTFYEDCIQNVNVTIAFLFYAAVQSILILMSPSY